MPAKIKKKISTRLIIDDFSEINIVNKSCRKTFTDQKVIHFVALNTAFTAAVFTTRLTARTRISRPGPVPSRRGTGMGWD